MQEQQRLRKPKEHVRWNPGGLRCREPHVRPGVGSKHKVQTSDPDLVTKLSEEEAADPLVVTAAQGQLSTEEACVKTMGPLWVQGRGAVQGGQESPSSALQDPRKGMLHGKG